MSNNNLPAGCTDRDTDGPIVKQPDDIDVTSYVTDNWRSCLDDATGFQAVEVDGVEMDDEITLVHLTVVVPVYWVDVP